MAKKKIWELSIMAVLTLFGSLWSHTVELHLFEQVSNCQQQN
jgi:hypothetical protein